jgi:hypothetical protein
MVKFAQPWPSLRRAELLSGNRLYWRPHLDFLPSCVGAWRVGLS